MKTSGIKITEIVEGAGQVATRRNTVIVNVRYFLNRGEEVFDKLKSTPRTRIDLFKREAIAGLRRGIEGMRVGGRRSLIISPHMAYGAEGWAGHVPPNVILRCEVELLEVREPGVMTREDYPPGRHLLICRQGDDARNLLRWQFGLHGDGRCGIGVTHPIPGVRTRGRVKYVDERLDLPTTEDLFRTALSLPTQAPGACLSEGDPLDLTIGIQEQGEWLCYYYLRESSEVWLGTPLHEVVSRLLAREARLE